MTPVTPLPLKGNAIVGQSGGPTAVINASLAGVIRAALASDSIEVLFGAKNGIEGVLNDELIPLQLVFDNQEKLALLCQTPAAALGSCRKKLPEPGDNPSVYEQIFALFRRNNIRYFFYIGGNDSMDTVKKLHEYAEMTDYAIRVVGVPKTIDNDVFGTDHTPGYGSAAKFVAVSMQEILRDCAVYQTKAVTIVEIMGRDSGWLTASAAITKRLCGVAPDYIYLPERPFSYEQFFSDLRAAMERHHTIVVAVSEGIRFEDGTYVGASSQNGVTDVFGHQYLAGTGKTLEHAVKHEFGCKVRSVELNILQRCAAHLNSKTDIDEAFLVGGEAVKRAVSGESGVMLGLRRDKGSVYGVSFISDKIEDIANRERHVPDVFINEDGNGVTDLFLDYVIPLIQGECDILWKNGLPLHFSFD